MRHARVHLQIRKRSESDTKMVIWRIIGTSTRFEFSRRMQLNGSDILLISRRRKKETNISQDLVVDELSLHNSMTWSWESCQNPLFGLDGSIILTFNSLYIRLNIFPNKRIIRLCTVVAALRPLHNWIFRRASLLTSATSHVQSHVHGFTRRGLQQHWYVSRLTKAPDCLTFS